MSIESKLKSIKTRKKRRLTQLVKSIGQKEGNKYVLLWLKYLKLAKKYKQLALKQLLPKARAHLESVGVWNEEWDSAYKSLLEEIQF